MTPRDLEEAPLRWQECWADLGVAAPADELPRVLAAWSEPGRHYHDLRHLRECLQRWQAWRSLAQRPGEVGLALWYHDIVYDPKAGDNERRSAERAAAVMRAHGAPPEAADRVHALVMATCHDAPAHTPDAQLLVDIDLAVLGAAPARFDEYDRDVRAEYGWVPEAVYRERRAEVLAQFLQRDRLYQTAPAFESLEQAARANLAAAIARLRG